ncbi:MAG: transporter substrate-binding domain-containing protein [Acidobacteriota bacterium]|nr:transporter substrate-binding domain-containing protein [Acidobacteriota bacterium]
MAFFISVFLLLTSFSTSCSNDDEQIKAIRDRGFLRVGVKVDVPRFGYLNPVTNKMEGMEIDLARAVARDILGDENAVRFMNITAQTRGPMLDNGEIDIVIATFTITEERKKSFNFSRPYFTDELGYLVRKDSSVRSSNDLNGKSIGVAKASTAMAAFESESKDSGISVTLSEYSSYPEIKAALINGDVEAFVSDKSILYGYLDDACILLDEGFNPQQYGIAGKLTNHKLAARVNSLMETLENNGELAAILEKWGL